MNRIIFCTYLKRKAKGLDFQIYPGKIGNKIFNEISKEAWGIWIYEQTKLINEKKLSTINQKDIQFLEKKMKNFLFKKK